MGVTTSLVLSFVLGLGIAFSSRTALRRGMSEFRDIVSKTINTAIIPLLPVYIFGIFMIMTVEGEVGMILRGFIKIIGVIFVLHVFVLLLQYCIAASFARRNPLSMLRTMLPAYFTALGTQSSAATIPCDSPSGCQNGCERGYGRICDTALRYYPSQRQYA